MKLLRPFLPFLVLAFVLGVLVTAVQKPQELRRKAAPATTLSFSPANLSVHPGDTFDVSILVETGENTISAADISISFDKNKLQGKSIVADDFLTNVLISGAIGDGKATITLGSPPTSPKKGNGKLATVIFRAKDSGTTQVSFTDATQIAGIGENTNVIIGKTPATVTIGSGGSVSKPTLTPTPRRSSQSKTQPSPVPPAEVSAQLSTCTCGDGICQKDNCGESAFTCAADCKSVASDATGLPTLPIVSEKNSEPFFVSFVRKVLSLFGIRF